MPAIAFQLKPEELEFSAIRAQGAGGQNVNKVSNAIMLRFDVRASSLPEGSPTRVVPPPMSAMGRPPVFCSQRSIMMGSMEPTCSEGAVQSKPI